MFLNKGTPLKGVHKQDFTYQLYNITTLTPFCLIFVAAVDCFVFCLTDGCFM